MIAVDAMGGDYAPSIAVQGAYAAASKGVAITLYGQERVVVDILNSIDVQWQKLPLSVVDCSENIGMSEEPTKSVLKSDSSLMRALQAVTSGYAQATVSAGNSGAAVVGSIVEFGRVPGLKRPALGSFLPTYKGSVFMIDIGANVDCKPEYLLQFASMGHVFVQQHKNIKKPRIALLSNGEEREKGSLATKQAYYLLEQSSLHFVGNLEPRELFNDYADVIVCDGFVGNIVLKTMQGTSTALLQFIKKSFMQSLWGRMVAWLVQPFFQQLKQTLDYSKTGGALLLGVNHPLIIAHGCSNAQAFENAILFADRVVREKTIEHFNHELATVLNFDFVTKKHKLEQEPESRS